MLKLGIDEQWFQLTMEIVCIDSYSVLTNGKPTRYITPSHGIKLRDPLFPYLFLLCAEELSSLKRTNVVSEILHGI